jgi:hypothetical protein
VAALLTAALWSGTTAQAANILVNPGFEADGQHGNGADITGWTFSAGDTYWINVDPYAHSGNNYYKVWGQFNGSPNYNAVWQDNSSLPGSIYQADGWLFTLGSDLMWSGDGADYAWLEVTFRDAGNNILALYRSALFNTNYNDYTNTWIDFPITNICQTNPPYTVIGSTNQLVAPPGTVTVRFQHTLYQLLYGGGSVYFDDANLNQTGGPVPPTINSVYPGTMNFASNHISFTINSASSTPIPTSGIHLVVNGTDVSSGLSISGSSPSINVSYAGLQNNVWAYTASITVTDAIGFTASASMKFDTIQPTFLWEAEDYDFTNGMYYNFPSLTSTPQPNSYYGVTGTYGVDYTSAASGQAFFRTNDTTGTGPAGDSARQAYLDAQMTDPSVIDWTVGYIGLNDWFNYTRDYPTGTFNVYGRLASGAGAPTTVSVDDVTGTPVNLGVFAFLGTDWGAYQYVPIADTNGNLVPIVFNGKRTLQITLTAGGDNMNYFFLVPAQVGLPLLSGITPADGSAMVTNPALSFTATATDGTTINNSGIQLLLNGSDVSGGLSISGSTTVKNVSYPSLTPNTVYTAIINVTNSTGVGVTRTIKFDTIQPGNFYVENEDYDYGGGLWDTANNGLTYQWYLGLDPVTNVDFAHVSAAGETFPYRPGLGQEDTSDILLPGYNSDYDIAWFNTGDWANYTRNYPTGHYYVYARLAGYNQAAYLDQVVSGQGMTSQTLKRLGTWSANSGGWQNWVWVLLTAPGSSSPAVVTLGGTNTLRVTSGGDCNCHFFMFVPVTGIQVSASASGNNVLIKFPSALGQSYRVFSRSSLSSGGWTLLTTVSGNGSVQSVSVPAAAGQQYYQVTSP